MAAVPSKLLKANKRLNTAYLLKESFGQLWDYQTESWARAFFERWKQSLKWQRLTPYEKFAAMIDRHWDGIASYCHPENKVSLGLVEGLNNKIRVLQRRAYGYRDEEYLKLKIVAAFLPPLPRSAEKRPTVTRGDPVRLGGRWPAAFATGWRAPISPGVARLIVRRAG